jgi:hypothetical protein
LGLSLQLESKLLQTSPITSPDLVDLRDHFWSGDAIGETNGSEQF